jgi:hypothetical protein
MSEGHGVWCEELEKQPGITWILKPDCRQLRQVMKKVTRHPQRVVESWVANDPVCIVNEALY